MPIERGQPPAFVRFDNGPEFVSNAVADWCEETGIDSAFDTMPPDATQVADPFHVVKLENTALDECRRCVQNETPGHSG